MLWPLMLIGFFSAGLLVLHRPDDCHELTTPSSIIEPIGLYACCPVQSSTSWIRKGLCSSACSSDSCKLFKCQTSIFVMHLLLVLPKRRKGLMGYVCHFACLFEPIGLLPCSNVLSFTVCLSQFLLCKAKFGVMKSEIELLMIYCLLCKAKFVNRTAACLFYHFWNLNFWWFTVCLFQ